MMSKSLSIVLGAVLLGAGRLAQAAEVDKLTPFSTQDVVFPSSGLRLAAKLLVPRTDGKVPGAVIIHGSGESDRSNPWTRAYAEALVGRGIAVLHPDKRGCGKSQGNWRSASLLDLADDALAAIETLRTNERVDPARGGGHWV